MSITMKAIAQRQSATSTMTFTLVSSCSIWGFQVKATDQAPGGYGVL